MELLRKSQAVPVSLPSWAVFSAEWVGGEGPRSECATRGGEGSLYGVEAARMCGTRQQCGGQDRGEQSGCKSPTLQGSSVSVVISLRLF